MDIDQQAPTSLETTSTTTTSTTSTTATTTEPSTTTASSTSAAADVPTVSFTVSHDKNVHQLTLPVNTTVGALRQILQDLTGVPASPPEMMKLMHAGLLKDDSKTLSDIKVVKGTKMMMLGKNMQAITKLQSPNNKSSSSSSAVSDGPKIVVVEPLSTMTKHKKILAKGKPDDAMEAHRYKKDKLPSGGIVGLYNNSGTKVRLAFKSFEGVLNISSAETTQKYSYGQISNIKSEEIIGDEKYHIMSLQLGKSEATTIYLYFVPAQYVDAIKDEILGSWG